MEKIFPLRMSILIVALVHRYEPNGKCLFIVPFVWDEHEAPYDFARYSSFGLIHLLKKMDL